MVSFPQASPAKPCAHLSPSPYAPHAQPISFFLILPPAQSTDIHQTKFVSVVNCVLLNVLHPPLLHGTDHRRTRIITSCCDFCHPSPAILAGHGVARPSSICLNSGRSISDNGLYRRRTDRTVWESKGLLDIAGIEPVTTSVADLATGAGSALWIYP
jgi:hypothetical protein